MGSPRTSLQCIWHFFAGPGDFRTFKYYEYSRGLQGPTNWTSTFCEAVSKKDNRIRCWTSVLPNPMVFCSASHKASQRPPAALMPNFHEVGVQPLLFEKIRENSLLHPLPLEVQPCLSASLQYLSSRSTAAIQDLSNSIANAL